MPQSIEIDPQIDYDRLAEAIASHLPTTTRWMRTKEAMVYTAHRTNSFIRFVKEQGVPVHREGKINYYDRADLDRAMSQL